MANTTQIPTENQRLATAKAPTPAALAGAGATKPANTVPGAGALIIGVSQGQNNEDNNMVML